MAIQQVNAINAAVPARRRPFINLINRYGTRIGDFLLNHWQTIITYLLGVIVLSALSVPLLTYFGLDGIAKPLFYSLHYICAQIPSHSFYIFGHQFGMCARNLSIYASMFAGSLVFTLSKKRMPGIPWWAWVLMILPIALDGTTQLVGLRESTWELRLITGTLFGLGNVWFVLPYIHKTIVETSVVLPRLRATLPTNTGTTSFVAGPPEQSPTQPQ